MGLNSLGLLVALVSDSLDGEIPDAQRRPFGRFNFCKQMMIMKSTEFKFPENEVETEAEQHAEETRRAVSAASKGQQTGQKKQPRRGKGRRQQEA